MQPNNLLPGLTRLHNAVRTSVQREAFSNAGRLPQVCRMTTQNGAHVSIHAAACGEEEDAERRKLVSRLMYRSKQRGFLELDLLVGLWAQKHLPSMSLPALQAFSEVLDVDNPDLFKWLTGQLPADAGIAQNPSFQAMQTDIASRLQETRPQQSATQPGKVWLRGWDDWKKEEQPAAKG